MTRTDESPRGEELEPPRLRFPVLLVVVPSVLSLVLLAWTVVAYRDLHRADDSVQKRILELERLRGTILQLDEVLTMSARMGAATGDTRWEERYLRHEPKLDEAIQRAGVLAPANHAEETNDANLALVALEKLAFAHVRQGRSEEAKSLLSSEAYEEHKQQYAAGVRGLAADLALMTVQLIEDQQRHERRASGIVIALLVGILLSGSAALASLDRSRARLLHENAARRDAQLRARNADEAKGRFLANMSHEIRTPLTAILGYTREIYEGGDLSRVPAERLHALATIERNGHHLLQLVNDILDVSKIEAGRLEILPEPISLIRLMGEIQSLLRLPADEKGLEILFEWPTPVPETIETDPTRLRQILINLIGNAIKFSDEGTIRVVIRLVSDHPNASLQFEVIDTGVGMMRQDVERLFQPFMQADGSTTRRYGGTGLGLTICKSLIEVMGGTIDVESEPAMGSNFRVTLPVNSLAGTPLIEDPSAVLSTGELSVRDSRSGNDPRVECRILVAEDAPDNQRLVRRILERAGAEIEVARNGRIALDMALAAHRNGEPFDVILMDMQMPVLDGYDATRALRNAGYTAPIVALTAHSLTGDRERCLSAGCDDFATKPIDRSDLLSKIATLLEKS